MPFGDLLTQLARYAGAGQQRGIAEEEAIQAQIKGFERLAPVRRATRAENIEAEYGPEAGAQALAGVFPGVTPYKEQLAATKKAEAERQLAGEVGAPLRKLMIPGEMPTPERAEGELEVPPTPFKVPERLSEKGASLLYGLLEKQEAARTKEPPQRSMTTWRAVAQTPGHPEQAQAKRVIEGYIGERTEVVRRGIAEQPLPGQTQKDIESLEGTLRRIRGGIRGASDKETKTRVETYLSPSYGGSAGAREYLNQLTGGRMMSPEEQSFRATVRDITDMLLRARSGAQINEQEYRRLVAIAPNLDMAPENFIKRLADFEAEFEAVIKAKKRLAITARREYVTGKPAMFDDFEEQ